ncbi:MAG: hemerythrin family protein, partial [Gemmatimonadota bacterium]
MSANCWDFKGCGLGPGAEPGSYNGRNAGAFASRFCWEVLGTVCFDAVQSTAAEKMTTCIRCDFYKHIRQQAGPNCEVSLLWDPALEFGIPPIDGQHRRLVMNLEDILAAVGDTTNVMQQCLQFLVKYTHEHFRTEERLMAEHQFPGLAEHARAHAAFREAMTKAVKLVSKAKDPAECTPLVKSMMVNWYVAHVTGLDQKYAACFRSRNVAHLIQEPAALWRPRLADSPSQPGPPPIS